VGLVVHPGSLLSDDLPPVASATVGPYTTGSAQRSIDYTVSYVGTSALPAPSGRLPGRITVLPPAPTVAPVCGTGRMCPDVSAARTAG
jgi:hypothetical protein